MAEDNTSLNIKVDEPQEQVDGKTNGENETKSPIKKSEVAEVTSPKQQNNEKAEMEVDEDEESESDEELPLGSLEGPVQIMEGKRERKKVERLTLEKKETPEKKKFEIVDGKGTKLGEIERISHILSKTHADQLKFLYKFLFGRTCKAFETKRHIRLFSGFSFTEDDPEYDKKEQYLVKLTVTALKDICSFLDLERKGNKELVMKRIMDFCFNPVSSGKKVPTKKKKALKRKRSSSGKDKSQKKTKKAKKEKTQDSEETVSKQTVDDCDLSDVSSISSISSDSEEEAQEKEEKPRSKPKKTPVKKVVSEQISDDEEPKRPKKKKAKETPKKQSTPKKEKKSQKEEKKKSPKKSVKKSVSPKKSTKSKKTVVSSDSDSSDSEPIIKKRAPSDSELKSTIETLLEKANLEEITMKAFCKQVYANYPEFDLKHKKEFIKSTVKMIVS